MEAQIARITVQTESIELELAGDADKAVGADGPSRQIVSLPWSKKPFRETKGIASDPTTGTGEDPKTNIAVLTAIAKARLWVDELTRGISLAEIAKKERKGERQIRLLIPLAFISPKDLVEIAKGNATRMPTELAQTIPIVWNA